MRIEFICIIWTDVMSADENVSSWGLNLFVLFEPFEVEFDEVPVLEDWIYLYYLNKTTQPPTQTIVLEDWIYLYYLNEKRIKWFRHWVLEDWIYLYYLNTFIDQQTNTKFLRIEFICIIWTRDGCVYYNNRSWGLNLFVLFEHISMITHRSYVLEDWIYLYYLNVKLH